jgi:hypothetical protein
MFAAGMSASRLIRKAPPKSGPFSLRLPLRYTGDMNPRGNFISTVISVLLVAGAGYIAYQKYYPSVPCREPIRYSIGLFDERFGISKDDFIAEIEAASAIWEGPVGKDLFRYDPKGPLVINLIYDERQATTDRNQELESSISGTKDSAASVQAQYQALKARHAQEKAAYDSALSAYSAAQDRYEQSVRYYNARGGAPKPEYQRLQEEKASLQAEAAALEEKRLELNATVERINSLIDTYNLLVSHVNATVSDINKTAGKEFNEGLYVEDGSGTRIDIYEYESKLKLLRVLAHELGHALSLEHNDNPLSIMYALNESSTDTLSADDLASLKVRCRITQ